MHESSENRPFGTDLVDAIRDLKMIAPCLAPIFDDATLRKT